MTQTVEHLSTVYAYEPELVEKPTTTPAPRLSVVIPLYNEVENIPHLYTELSAAMDDLGDSYEVVIVDDGSTDGSFIELRKVYERDPHWRVIRFRRNFGQTAGLMAGFEAARGEYIITMDADLQNDPRDIGKLLEKAEEGYDIVSGWRMERKEPFFSRRLPSMLANRLISSSTGVSLHDYGCTLKVYRKEVAKNIRLYGELHRFIPAIASGLGVQLAEVPVADRARRFGKSKYGIMRTFKVMLDLITVVFFLSFSTRPLHIFGGVGLVTGALGVAIGGYLTIVRLFFGQPIGDRPLLLLAMLLIILGVQITGTGLVAEFVMRTYHEPQGRKTYVVRETLDKK
ncbi:MAG: glycosyltransferase family 2 protein [Anaerolinea sp.]|nr:glycosyltransferase family 2 protein [Anaerolinea sp.]